MTTPASKYRIVATHYIKQGSEIPTYQDCHLGSTAACMSVDEFLAKFTADVATYPLVLALGDNWDMMCVANKLVAWLQAKRNLFRAMYRKLCVSGNHSGEPSQIGEVIIVHVTNEAGEVIYSIAFLHPDCFDYERWLKYRGKAKGAGWLKRTFWVNGIETFEKLHDRKIKQKVIDAAREACKELGVQKIYGGHYHIDSIIDLGNKLTLQLLGRGRRVLKV